MIFFVTTIIINLNCKIRVQYFFLHNRLNKIHNFLVIGWPKFVLSNCILKM